MTARRKRDRMSFAEVAAMMRQPSYRRPIPVPPSLHQMAARRRIVAVGADSPSDRANPKETEE